jgi:hypothetical protein
MSFEHSEFLINSILDEIPSFFCIQPNLSVLVLSVQLKLRFLIFAARVAK